MLDIKEIIGSEPVSLKAQENLAIFLASIPETSNDEQIKYCIAKAVDAATEAGKHMAVMGLLIGEQREPELGRERVFESFAEAVRAMNVDMAKKIEMYRVVQYMFEQRGIPGKPKDMPDVKASAN